MGELESRLETLRQSDKPTIGIEVNLLLALIRKGEVEKAEQVKKVSVAQCLIFSPYFMTRSSLIKIVVMKNVVAEYQLCLFGEC